MNKLPEGQGEGSSCVYFGNSIDKLNSYTQDAPWDWISKAKGLEYIRLGKSEYNTFLEQIELGYKVMLVKIDHNITDLFTDKYSSLILEYVY